ncbi:MAG: RNA polymerase sigma factor [Bacteroidales bacterium]
MAQKGKKGIEFSDQEIIRRCSRGEEKAQEMLYKHYFSFAMSVCIRYTADESEAMEIVNDSFMKVLDNINEYDKSKPFSAWYGRILVNTAIDSYRKNSRRASDLQLSDIEEVEEIEPEILSELSAENIIDLFRELPETYRIVFNLYEIEGYSHKDISEMLGIPPGTSRSNLARAKKMLRSLYARHFYPLKQSHG